jgi:hypothetical protein
MRHKRQPTHRVDNVNELLLLGRQLSSRPLHLDCEVAPLFGNTANDV